MADESYIRFVNDQRVQVRSLLLALEKTTEAVQTKSFFCAAVRAAELALLGYFAELTQKRFQMPLWQKLLHGDHTFTGLQKYNNNNNSNSDGSVITYWLSWEVTYGSPLHCVRAAIEQVNTPSQELYKQGLLAQTSLVGTTNTNNLIASSAITQEVKRVSHKEFAKAWALVEAQILYEREQALEC